MIDFKNDALFKLAKVDSLVSVIADIMVDGEVEVASYKALRDSVIFTNKRVIAINVQGISGKKIDYTSLPYSKIVAFSIETSGTFDWDSELELYFSGLGKVKFEFRGNANVREISKIIADYSL